MVRIGHPARVLPSVSGMTLDSRLARADGSDVIRDMRKDISRVRSQLQQARDKRQGAEKKSALRAELRDLGKDLRVREARVLQSLLNSAAVVLATTTGAGDRVLAQARPFDWVVIDEAAQALEAACWIPILKGAKLVLAGDDKQLPPTIKSDEAARVKFQFVFREQTSKHNNHFFFLFFKLFLYLYNHRMGFPRHFLSDCMKSMAHRSQGCSQYSTA